MQQADTPERLDRYEARLRAFPAYLEAWAEVGRDGIAAGVTAPRVVAERSIGQVERLLALAAEDSPALMPAADDAARDADRRGRPRRREPRVRGLPGRAPRLPAARHRDARPVVAPRRRGDVRGRGPVVDLAPARPSRGARARATRGSTRSRRSGTGSPATLGYASSARGPRGLQGERRRRRRQPRGARRDRRGPGAAQLGLGRPVVRTAPVVELRGARGRGLPRGRHADGLLQPADRGRLASGRLLHQHVRPAEPRAALDRGRDVPRGEPGPPFPDRARTGGRRSPEAPAVRRDPRGQRLHGGLGPVRGTSRRRDGPVPRRLGAARDAREPGPARGPADHRHRPARAGVGSRARDREAPGRRGRRAPTPRSRSTATSRCPRRRSAT